MERKIKNNPDIFTYVITETGIFNSLDPLDADQTVNLPVARMLYSTPLEIDLNGELTSSILESFDFNQQSQTITWKVKSGLKYSDGSDLTAEEVALSVARMALARPKFPVLEDIDGLQEWIVSKDGLKSFPKGIKVDGNLILIDFSKNQDHPLFRFCLELFSVIPKRCINLDSNKISCAEIPSSGYYKMTSKNESEIIFERSSYLNNLNLQIPYKIAFKYMNSQKAIENLSLMDLNTVISGNEVRYSVDELKKMNSELTMSYMPASRIAAIIMNPNSGPFADVHCRQIFAKAFRSVFEKISNNTRKIEASFMTDLLPGYLNSKELSASVDNQLSDEIIKSCKLKLEKQPVKWLKTKSNPNSIFVQIMEKVFDELNIKKSEPIVLENQKNEEEMFFKGEISLVGFQTGFWAFDPAGDIQMLMTPNMHDPLDFVSGDAELQKLIKGLKTETNEKTPFIQLNNYIYEKSLFNVFTHVRRFYASKNKSLLTETPVAITSPAPWQVFKVD